MENSQGKKGKEKLFPPRKLASSIHTYHPSITSVELAGLAIRFNIRLRSSDMPVPMQEHAFRYTRSLVDEAPKSNNTRPNSTYIARSLKKEFDLTYGPAWHCVVGTSFGSFVTHSHGGFIYFSLDSLSFLLFKTKVQLVPKSELESA